MEWIQMTAEDRPLKNFGVSASFIGEQAILAIRGEIDILTAPEFGAFFDATIDRGYQSVTLDLTKLNFMDASGLDIIAGGADRLELSGGSLTIRTPSAMIRHILAVTGLARLIALEPPEPLLGVEEAVETLGEPHRTGIYGITNSLRKITAIHSDNELVDGALRLAVNLARVSVGGADGVSVSLRRHGRLATVAATDQTISHMDANQYSTGEGPCIDASMQGHWFHAESLESETRWPAFTPRARALGINAILSSPLLVSDRPVGALNIYSLKPAAFSPTDQEVAAQFATETSIILRGTAVDVTDDQLASRFLGALRAREVIAQAQGVLMERDGLDEEEAYNALRRFSLGSSTPLHERATDIVFSARPRRQPPIGRQARESSHD
jgi:anti-anti-sigma factor